MILLRALARDLANSFMPSDVVNKKKPMKTLIVAICPPHTCVSVCLCDANRKGIIIIMTLRSERQFARRTDSLALIR